MKKIGFLLILIFSSTLLWADENYRDTPPVMEPVKPAIPPDIIDPAIKAFKQYYKKAGYPKIALFWNIELTDSIKDRQVKSETISGSNKESVNKLIKSTTGPEGTANLTDGDETSNFNITRTVSKDTITDNNKRTTSLAESDMWKSQTAFKNILREAGVKFIDRNAILRTTALKENTENLPALETKALLGKADLLMEVLMVRDPDAPLGWGFKVSLLDLNSGEEKSSLYSQARPILTAPAKSEYKATNTGFQKITYQTQATVDDIGVALAVDVMNNTGLVLSH